MNICELINECGGPDKVNIQFIDQCADKMDDTLVNGKPITRVTFGTEQALTPDGLTKLGVIVWLDREEVKSAIAKAAQ